MKSNLKKTVKQLLYVSALFIFMFNAGCSSYKRISYFKDVPDSLKGISKEITTVPYDYPKIQPNDILQINIQTLDPQVANLPLNMTSNTMGNAQGIASSTFNSNETTPTGYLVDNDGDVNIPQIGKIKIGGLTLAEAGDSITSRISMIYRQPVVNVTFANFQITVLGEVAHPGKYIIPNGKVSILDAIGLAGDLTIYGKRSNVLLIRTEKNTKKFIRFDLNSSDIFISTYYYLRQDDIVYIEPNKAKAASTDASKNRVFTIIASAATVLIVLLSRVNL